MTKKSAPQPAYTGLIAATWDLWRGDTSRWEDRFFYLQILHRYGQPVLDVGCATGRLLLDYLALGIDVEGVDNSPEMLALCREKADRLGLSPSLHQQSMETLDLPRRYRTILVPSSSFQLVTDPERARRALLSFHLHLQPGGALVMPFSFDWREGEPIDKGWELLFERRRPEDGAVVRSWSHEWIEPARQLTHSEQRFEIELEGQVVTREEHRQSPETRWYTQEQARQAFAQAGFVRLQVLSGFTGRPATPDERFFSLVGEKD